MMSLSVISAKICGLGRDGFTVDLRAYRLVLVIETIAPVSE